MKMQKDQKTRSTTATRRENQRQRTVEWQPTDNHRRLVRKSVGITHRQEKKQRMQIPKIVRP